MCNPWDTPHDEDGFKDGFKRISHSVSAFNDDHYSAQPWCKTDVWGRHSQPRHCFSCADTRHLLHSASRAETF